MVSVKEFQEFLKKYDYQYYLDQNGNLFLTRQCKEGFQNPLSKNDWWDNVMICNDKDTFPIGFIYDDVAVVRNNYNVEELTFFTRIYKEGIYSIFEGKGE